MKVLFLSELGRSSFRQDGYKDAINGHPPSPPAINIFETEYNEGYAIGLADLQRIQESK